MKKLLMTVYNNIQNDARVLRAAEALCGEFELYLYAVGSVERAGIKCIPVDGVEKIGGAQAYLRYVRGVLKTARELRPDIIYGHDIFSALPLDLLRRTNKTCKYIYDAHELFTKEKGRSYGLVDRLQYACEGKMIRCADLTVCAEKQRAAYMKDYHGLKKEPLVIRNISYLPVGNADTFLQENADFFEKKALGIVYAGGLLAGRRLERLVEAVDRLGEGYKLMLIGNGPARDMLAAEIEKRGNPNLRISPAVPYAELGAILSHFDVGYLFYGNDNLNNLYCAPNKIYEYASVGLPILANDNPTVGEIVERAGIGVCDDEIEQGLEKLARTFESCRENMNQFIAENSLESEMQLLRAAVGAL